MNLRLVLVAVMMLASVTGQRKMRPPHHSGGQYFHGPREPPFVPSPQFDGNVGGFHPQVEREPPLRFVPTASSYTPSPVDNRVPEAVRPEPMRELFQPIRDHVPSREHNQGLREHHGPQIVREHHPNRDQPIREHHSQPTREHHPQPLREHHQPPNREHHQQPIREHHPQHPRDHVSQATQVQIHREPQPQREPHPHREPQPVREPHPVRDHHNPQVVHPSPVNFPDPPRKQHHHPILQATPQQEPSRKPIVFADPPRKIYPVHHQPSASATYNTEPVRLLPPKEHGSKPHYRKEHFATPIPIIKLDKQQSVDGSYKSSYETGNSIFAEETGFLKGAVEPNEEASLVQHGSYSYTDPDGNIISVRYTADEGGFRAEGDHLPTPPPIPPEIQKGLDLIYEQIRIDAENAAQEQRYQTALPESQNYNHYSSYNEQSDRRYRQ